jgi:hypothetical protein
MASRREFLSKTSAIAGMLTPAALYAQQKTDNLPPNVPAWMREQGEEVNWRAYGPGLRDHRVRAG